ncbi:MAG: radical SAM protein [Candidatus Altiarchaeota archaeon]|nr:radical SAM protein [Candidatus Altiarchaeota archaeon]
MKVLLLNLPDMAWSGKGYSAHLGLGYIAAVLERAGHEVKVLDLAVTKELCRQSYLGAPKFAVREITDFQPDVVGASMTTTNRFNVVYWSKLIKELFPNSKFIVGGPHILYDAPSTLEYAPTIDCVVKSEGENTTVELCKAYENGGKTKDISGLYIRDSKGKAHDTGNRPFIEDLDSLPFPARHLFPMKDYDFRIGKFKSVKTGTAITSRGCPIGCKFCSTSHYWGRKYRFRSAKNIVDEIELVFNDYPFVREMVFFDDSMTIRRDRVSEICSEIKNRKLDFDWACWSRVDIVNKPMLEEMHDAGCSIISFGVESGSQRMLENIGKRTTVEQIKSAIRMCQDVGIEPRATIIIGLPGETMEDVDKTIKLIRKMAIYPGDVHINCFTMLLPGTPWFEEFQEKNPDFNWMNPPDRFKETSITDKEGNILIPKITFSKKQVQEIKDRIKMAKLSYTVYRYPQYLPRRFWNYMNSCINAM